MKTSMLPRLEKGSIHLLYLLLILGLTDTGCGNDLADESDTTNDETQKVDRDSSIHNDSDSEGHLADDSDLAQSSGDKKIGNIVFDDSKVLTVRLNMAPKDVADLNNFAKLINNTSIPPAVIKRYLPAEMTYGNIKLEKVGIRYKGDQSITGCIDWLGKKQTKVMEEYGGMNICAKFSFKIDVNRFEKKSRLDGLKKINLHSMAADPSKMHEMLGYHLFRQMDVHAPRTAYVKLYLNDDLYGLYLAVEQVDGRFTADRYPEYGDGNLYKEIWPTKSKTKANFVQALKTNDEPDVVDVSGIIAFREDLASAKPTDFQQVMDKHLDFEHLARYIVVDRAIANFDGIMVWYGMKVGGNVIGAYNHNFYWYREQQSGKFILIPWDLDKSFIYEEPIFWSNNQAVKPHGIVPNYNVVTNSCGGYNVNFDPGDFGAYGVREIDCDKLLRLSREVIWDRLADLTQQLNAGPFEQTKVESLVGDWKRSIHQVVKDDTTIDFDHFEQAVKNFLEDLPKHRSNVELMMDNQIEL